MSTKYRGFSFAAACAAVAVVIAATLYPVPAEAIPAFARKHDLSCTACHTKPPRLNEFGEAFHMAGLQIPMVRDGERHRKRQIGHIWSETDLLNIFSARATGNVLESTSGATVNETRTGFPQEVELYLAGTLTEDISYFFTLSGDEDHFGIGHEFHVMANLEPLFRRRSANDDHDAHAAHGGHGDDGPMIMGPMVMFGRIDPSTSFSYPTNRQLIATLPGHGDQDDGRFALRPYAFASKFFGIENAAGNPVEVTRPVLYNTDGDSGLDFHMMIDRFLLQAGFMQGVESGTRNVGHKVDPYLMARMNFGGDRYLSGSVSALVQWGFETAQVENEPVDWRRYGLAANLKYHHLDLYGAVIRDRIRDLPAGLGDRFDDDAWGLTIQADYLLTDPWLLSLRYDHMEAGGFVDELANGRVVTLQGRYYFRDNISFWLRDSWNAGDSSANPLQNFRHLLAAGVDLVF